MPHARPVTVTVSDPETEIVDRTHIACDGGEGALGHPRVWLQIDETIGWVECGYCDKKFVLGGHEVQEPGSNVGVDGSVGDRTDGDGLDAKA